MRGLPTKQTGLYEPSTERDACGIGFLVDIKGRKSHKIVDRALAMLKRLLHRGACGCDKNSGDGVGILIQKPDKFFRRVCATIGIKLADTDSYGSGLVFLPTEQRQAQHCQQLFAEIIKEEGQTLLGWRDIETDDSTLGAMAKEGAPCFKQIFIGKQAALTPDAFERKLYIIRKRVEHMISSTDLSQKKMFYMPSLSHRIFIYKGMLTGSQIESFFPDISDPDVESALALVHQRFSTNTLPEWRLAQPFRYICHNGEINTVHGNAKWMRARESLCKSGLLSEDLQKLFPIAIKDGSDSAIFDNVVEFLHMSGRPLPLVILMMIPEAWLGHATMDKQRKAFYQYHSCLMEPWDGPASIAFTDGNIIGAVLDRNGLRPSRYYVTKDDMVIMSSEVGVLEIAPEDILIKERLHPGRIFMVDTKQERIIGDAEIKDEFIRQHPYVDWLAQNLVPMQELPESKNVCTEDIDTLLQLQQAFGYTHEDLKLLIKSMAANGTEAIGSMGADTALAVLSNRPRLLYDYFKQLFAQVTNPPLDGIREELVMQIATTIGPEGDLLHPTQTSCRRISIDSPILTNAELAKIRDITLSGFKAQTISILCSFTKNEIAIDATLKALFAKVDQAIEAGNNYIILSDRGVNQKQAAIPALLAVAGVHHHLIRSGKRTCISLLLESAEPREVHHFATLLGYGANAINPYLSFASLAGLIRDKELQQITQQEATTNFIKAINKGLIKITSKMGISTIQSYCGAQTFEAIGLEKELVDQHFSGTASRIGGIGLDIIAKEVSMRHRKAFSTRPSPQADLDWGGEYQWRRDGEYHLFNPHTVFKLQHATRSGQYKIFKEYTTLVNEQREQPATLRGLFKLKYAQKPIPLKQVEPIEDIMRRFSTGAMSYGSISKQAHETLAIAMNRIGGKSNTGEGGEDPGRFTLDANGDSRRSAIKQVASGRFGVNSEYLAAADDIQIKIAQGAKPGEGGQLPGSKVYPWIAKVRNSTAWVELISPPPHHDIYSIEDLAQLIHDLKSANPNARIHVKLVSEVGVGTIAAGVAKARADVILISGYDGGTGASPMSSLKHAGLPWELGLAETQQMLLKNGLRNRISLQTDGQLKTGRDVVIAALLGAEEFGFSTAPLVVMGCIMMRVCHLNTCPVGIATQNQTLTKKFNGQPEFVENFFRYIAEEVRECMAKLGFRTINEMIGQSKRLDKKDTVTHWKAKTLDFSRLFYQPKLRPGDGLYCTEKQDHELEKALDNTTLIPLCSNALESRKKVDIITAIRNTDRSVGATLGYAVTKKYTKGLPEDTINIHCNGTAGMSFAAFIPNGITLTLEGDANDYIGKGLSGGKVIVYPPRHASFTAEKNILIGNVALYGATQGEAYFRGIAGERFCVRNSGACAVVEGVGDHGCEYMTGGYVLIIGKTGRNFAAGMSGGIAYVLADRTEFGLLCNQAMVDLDLLVEDDDLERVQGLLKKHIQYTQSTVAKKILEHWQDYRSRFVKIIPKQYKHVLKAIKKGQEKGLTEEEAVMEAGGTWAR